MMPDEFTVILTVVYVSYSVTFIIFGSVSGHAHDVHQQFAVGTS